MTTAPHPSERKFPKLNNYNEIYTPKYAVDCITPFLNKDLLFWEACYGLGHMAELLKSKGFNVVGEKEIDCLVSCPEHWDVFITNPPFNGNKMFIERAVKLDKPFAILIRLEHLGGVNATRILKGLPITVLIPEKRINYINPKILRGEKTGGSPFHSVWLTLGIVEQKGIVYV